MTKRGFTLMEVNLAVFIMAVGVMAMVALYPLGFRENQQSREDVAAADMADAVLNPLVAALSWTNMTWSAWKEICRENSRGVPEVLPDTGSGGWYGYIPITLAPYCVPLFTLVLLPWRFTTGNPYYLAAIDILIGFSYAFHVCCWIRQTRLHQTDITGPGTVRSILVIAIFHILNFCLIVLTPSSGVVLALKRVFWEFPAGFVTGLSG